MPVPLALSPRGPHRRLVLGAGAAIVIAVAIALVAWWPRAERDASRAEVPPGPVVLVPGYGGGTDGLDALAVRLRAAGHTVTVLQLVGDGTGDLQTQAVKLKATVDGLVSAGATSVDVVGYSAGGVVTRIWAGELGGAAVARRIVLLGSPNHGTALAGLGVALGSSLCSLACQQLAPDSALLKRLDADRDAPAGPQWVSIWTTADQVEHGQLPTDPAVQGLVLRALAATPWTVPGPADCASLRAH